MRRLAGHPLLSLLLLAVPLAALALAGCNGGGAVLRGVGTPAARTVAAPPAQALPAEEPAVVTQSALAAAGAQPPGAELQASTTREEAPIPVSSQIGRTARVEPGAGTPLNVTGPAVRRSQVAAEVPPEPAMAADREAAIRDIRAKAAAAGKNPPNVFSAREGTAEALSEAEKARLQAELEAAAAGNEAGVSPEEAQRRQEALKRLLRRADTHYKEALSSIEN